MNSIVKHWKMLALTACFAAVSALNGCAPAKPVVRADEAPGAEARKLGTAISTINVVGTGDAVLLESDGDIRYTAFRLTDPPRLVIDIPGVKTEGLSFPMEVNNNFLTTITSSMYGDGMEQIARIEIGLKDGIDYTVKAGENSILVDLKRDVYVPERSRSALEPVAQVEPEAAAESVVPEVPADAVEVPVAEPVVVIDEPAPVKEEAAKPVPTNTAKTITKIDSYTQDGATFVRIEGDGNILSYNSFGLDAPARVVIDISNVKSKLKKKTFAVSGEFIKSVRVGDHADKVRIVLDGKGSKKQPYAITKDGGNVLVRFGSAEASSEKNTSVAPDEPQPVDEAPVVVEEPVTRPTAAVKPSVEEPVAYTEMETSTPVSAESEGKFLVRKVVFKKLKDKARLTIEGTSKPSYKIKEAKDGKALYVDFDNAFIPDDLRLTMDATALGTQVSSVSSYQAAKPADTVRVLVKLSEQSSFTIKEGNRYLVVDFPLEVDADKAAGKEGEEDLGLDDKPGQKKAYTGAKIDIDLVGADIKEVIKLLAEVSEMNIIAGDDVTGTVTVSLKDVPWDQAFDLVLSAKGLDKVQDGNIIRVASKDKIKKEKEATLQEKVTNEKLEDLVTEYIRINYDKASSLSGQVKGIMTPRGTTTVHDTTNTLIIKDIASAIAEVKDFIRRVDVPTPQVLIEARIVEANTNFTRDIGVQMGGGVSDITTSKATQGIGFNTMGEAGMPVGLAYGLGGYGLTKTLASGTIFDLELLLFLGEQQGQVKTISRPRVVTMDNKEAKIEQGDSIPYSSSSATGTTTTFVDANLSLTVTPHITPDGSISMKIKASNNTPSSASGGGGEPAIAKKEASTEVLVKDGETTVIGGIVVTTSRRTDSGIPLLQNIPILGWLFKSKLTYEDQKELLIFITPTILKSAAK